MLLLQDQGVVSYAAMLLLCGKTEIFLALPSAGVAAAALLLRCLCSADLVYKFSCLAARFSTAAAASASSAAAAGFSSADMWHALTLAHVQNTHTHTRARSRSLSHTHTRGHGHTGACCCCCCCCCCLSCSICYLPVVVALILHIFYLSFI